MSKKSPPPQKHTSLLMISFFGILIAIISLILLILINDQQMPRFTLSNLSSIKKNIIPTPTKIPTPTLTPTPTYSPHISGFQLKIPILLYHYIGNNPNPDDKQRDNLSISPDKFEEQMKYLAENGYHTITLDTLHASLTNHHTLADKSLVLTFDDGYIDFFVNAYPILRRYNLHATVFIPTNLMNKGYYLTWDQIKEMNSSRLIHFGTHTIRHSHLPSLSAAAVTGELFESKTVLQNLLGENVNFMAYPYGATNENINKLVKDAGYLGAVGTWPSTIQSEGTLYDMPRIKVSGTYQLSDFIKLL